MEDIGIKMEEDIITYNLLKQLPNSLENIKQRITHSRDGEEIKPDILFNHLEIHLNELKFSASNKSKTIADSMFTNEDSKCTGGQHNPN
ncbi:hypothetical protein VP01_9912g2 [Puccinia sorghi]|uniref:Uncharacterized protein n=1 Tax=Puccinia sorghi TaxID=27349 RepID=A0A0L6U5E3_9BASI|nr:hypothetical protein VP01_9912g2 [Puccinia sorghi]